MSSLPDPPDFRIFGICRNAPKQAASQDLDRVTIGVLTVSGTEIDLFYLIDQLFQLLRTAALDLFHQLQLHINGNKKRLIQHLLPGKLIRKHRHTDPTVTGKFTDSGSDLILSGNLQRFLHRRTDTRITLDFQTTVKFIVHLFQRFFQFFCRKFFFALDQKHHGKLTDRVTPALPDDILFQELIEDRAESFPAHIAASAKGIFKFHIHYIVKTLFQRKSCLFRTGFQLFFRIIAAIEHFSKKIFPEYAFLLFHRVLQLIHLRQEAVKAAPELKMLLLDRFSLKKPVF